MPETTNYLAIDLGAESGRLILGALSAGRLRLEEIHRFANGPVRLPDGLHWDVLRLWNEIKTGIGLAARITGGQLSSLAVDTWGVDFALLDSQGHLLGNPHHYRDQRTDGMMAEVFRRLPRQAVYEATGIQLMQINSLYQLFSMVLENSPLLETASTFLTMPDLFNYWLSGKTASELTIATTTQCYDPRRQDWAWSMLKALGIPEHLFRPVIQPGTVLGSLLPLVGEETEAGEVPVIAPACHDTGSAVVAVPAEGKDFAWISSGTWSIMGVEAAQPSISADTLKYNFTNEGGAFGTWRLSKSMMGLWLVQECKRTWALHGEDLSYAEITKQAEGAQPFLAVIDPDHPMFLPPGEMPRHIQLYCQQSGQPVPQTKGEIIRVTLESIALKYRWVLERLEEITSARLEPVHIIGGGTRNRLLTQFTADATGRTVVAGPVEATAIGNLLMQAVALHQLDSLADARRVVRASFASEIFQPGLGAAWDESYASLLKLLAESEQID